MYAGAKVLVVEDEAAVAAVLHRLLTKKGCTVEAVSSGTEALERLKSGPYDVVISDIRMPGMSGIALWEQLRTDYPEQASRVIFVTGDTATPTPASSFEGRASPCCRSHSAQTNWRRPWQRCAAGPTDRPRAHGSRKRRSTQWLTPLYSIGMGNAYLR